MTTGISLILIIPVGLVTAVSNQEMTLNVLTELIGGFVVPGKALAMNMFKAYGTLTLMQAISFVDALKLGHYTKIPPRVMFRAQIVPTLLSVVIVHPINYPTNFCRLFQL
jgi:OPT oligopeptide transporter protein